METDPILDALVTLSKYGADCAVSEQSPAMLAGLLKDDLETLLQTGVLNDVSNRDLAQDDTRRTGFGIVYDDDKFDEFLKFKPPFDWFTTFLGRCHLARYNAASDSIELVSNTPLRSLLPKYVGHFLPLTAIDSRDSDGAHTYSIREFTHFCGNHWICDFTTNGMVCADPICAAAHCWIQDGHCYAYVHSGPTITSFHLYPFETEPEARTTP